MKAEILVSVLLAVALLPSKSSAIENSRLLPPVLPRGGGPIVVQRPFTYSAVCSAYEKNGALFSSTTVEGATEAELQTACYNWDAGLCFAIGSSTVELNFEGTVIWSYKWPSNQFPECGVG